MRTLRSVLDIFVQLADLVEYEPPELGHKPRALLTADHDLWEQHGRDETREDNKLSFHFSFAGGESYQPHSGSIVRDTSVGCGTRQLRGCMEIIHSTPGPTGRERSTAARGRERVQRSLDT